MLRALYTLRWLDDISRITHLAITRRNCSWCAWAWNTRLEHGWSLLVLFMGREHCRESWKRYF